MSGLLGLGTRRGRSYPVTNPVRIFLIDLDPRSGSALSRAIDLDRELAVVGCCSNLRRISDEIARCRPDLVAVRLGLDDERCTAVLSQVAGRGEAPCVVVLGAPSALADEAVVEASRLKARIRAVAEVNFDLPPEPPQVNRLLH